MRQLTLRTEVNCEFNLIIGEVFKEILVKFSEEFRSALRKAKSKYLTYRELLEDFESNKSVNN